MQTIRMPIPYGTDWPSGAIIRSLLTRACHVEMGDPVIDPSSVSSKHPAQSQHSYSYHISYTPSDSDCVAWQEGRKCSLSFLTVPSISPVRISRPSNPDGSRTDAKVDQVPFIDTARLTRLGHHVPGRVLALSRVIEKCYVHDRLKRVKVK
jgi:hypothetical protein